MVVAVAEVAAQRDRDAAPYPLRASFACMYDAESWQVTVWI